MEILSVYYYEKLDEAYLVTLKDSKAYYLDLNTLELQESDSVTTLRNMRLFKDYWRILNLRDIDYIKQKFDLTK